MYINSYNFAGLCIILFSCCEEQGGMYVYVCNIHNLLTIIIIIIIRYPMKLHKDLKNGGTNNY